MPPPGSPLRATRPGRSEARVLPLRPRIRRRIVGPGPEGARQELTPRKPAAGNRSGSPVTAWPNPAGWGSRQQMGSNRASESPVRRRKIRDGRCIQRGARSCFCLCVSPDPPRRHTIALHRRNSSWDLTRKRSQVQTLSRHSIGCRSARVRRHGFVFHAPAVGSPGSNRLRNG